MHQEGHTGLNLILFAPVAYWLVAHDELLVMGLAMVGVVSMAPIPDVDLHLPIKHRGPTHSVWFAIGVGATYAAILTYTGFGDLTILETASIGFASGALGVLGHIVGDMVTPMGVAPFEPVSSYWVGLGMCKSGDERVNRRLLEFGSTAFVVAIVLGTVDPSRILKPFLGL